MKTMTTKQIKQCHVVTPEWAKVSGNAHHLKIIGQCPKAGGGVHRWIFSAALLLKRRCDERTARAVIAHAVGGCGREVSEREIRDAVSKARGRRAKRTTPPWPQKNDRFIQAVAQNNITVAKLRELSPIKAGDLQTAQIIETLFPGDANKVLLCVGATINRAQTRPKIALMGIMHKMQFIVPNPMTALRGVKTDGEKSARCLANTGPRRFLVVESDPVRWDDLTDTQKASFENEENYIGQKKDEAAAVLWHLAEIAPLLPLVMVVDSAGKSLHGFFYVADAPEGYLVRFFRYAAALGADPATWTPCQFVRMPGGTRDNGKRQAVIYFNPKPMEVK
jgi:hypothetical protein